MTRDTIANALFLVLSGFVKTFKLNLVAFWNHQKLPLMLEARTNRKHHLVFEQYLPEVFLQPLVLFLLCRI